MSVKPKTRRKAKTAAPVAWWTPARLAKLEAELARWKGTPFRADSAAPGPAGGVDCLRLIDELNASCGDGPRFHFPRQPMDWTAHAKESLIERWLDGLEGPQSEQLARHFIRLPEGATAAPGDLVTFRIHKAAHHLGLALGNSRFAHVMWHSTVTTDSRLDDPTFGDRISRIYRRIEA